MLLYICKTINYNADTSFLHLFGLIIYGITSHIYHTHTHTHTRLKHCILHLKHANTQCKVHNLMSLHTYKIQNHNANIQLLQLKHAITLSQTFTSFLHLFVLIIHGITLHIRRTHHSNIVFYIWNTLRHNVKTTIWCLFILIKFKITMQIHCRYI